MKRKKKSWAFAPTDAIKQITVRALSHLGAVDPLGIELVSIEGHVATVHVRYTGLDSESFLYEIDLDKICIIHE